MYNRTLNVFGVFLLLTGVLATLNSIYLGNPNQIFWQCYIGLLIIGIGILSRNGSLIGSQLNILLIPSLIWDVDFIFQLISGNPFWGITDYWFTSKTITLGRIISLQHLFATPLALYTLYKIKVKKFDFWKISVIQVSLIYIFVKILTSPGSNINCTFESCLDFSLGLSYQTEWFIASFALIFFTNFLIWLFFRKTRKG